MQRFVCVGTYTHGGDGGIHTLRFDEETGSLCAAGPVEPAENPSYLAISPDRRTLYAVFETDAFGGSAGGAVASFAINPATGALARTGVAPAGSRAPCHLCADPTGRALYAANYGDGTVTVFPLREGGAVAPPALTLRDVGAGPDPARQEGPHAHFVTPTPDGAFLCIVDLGIDRVMLHTLDGRSGMPSPDAVSSVALPPGAGPRHMAFHPRGNAAYVLTELSNEVFAYTYEGGAFRLVQRLSALPGGYGGAAYGAAVRVSPCGRTLYASVRGHDSVAVYAVEQGTMKLTPLGHASCGGLWPRDIAQDPSGRWLLSANERSDTVAVFRIDDKTSMPRPSGVSLAVPKPTCVLFV